MLAELVKYCGEDSLSIAAEDTSCGVSETPLHKCHAMAMIFFSTVIFWGSIFVSSQLCTKLTRTFIDPFLRMLPLREAAGRRDGGFLVGVNIVNFSQWYFIKLTLPTR